MRTRNSHKAYTYFDGMVNQIYPWEVQLNKANSSDTEAPFFDLHLIILDDFVSSKIYDKRDNFDFDIASFPFLDGGIPHAPSYIMLAWGTFCNKAYRNQNFVVT